METTSIICFQNLPWNLASVVIKRLVDDQNVPLSLQKLIEQADNASDPGEWYGDETNSSGSYESLDDSNNQNTEAGNAVLVPLMQTCKRWRILVYKYLCATCSLTFNCNPERIAIDYSPPLPNGAHQHNPPIRYGLSNKLVINVDYLSILNGRALNMLTGNADSLNAHGFKSVTHLLIAFKAYEVNRLQPLVDDEQHIQAFVDFLELNIPRLNAVNVCLNDHSLDFLIYNSLSFANLFISLLGLRQTSCLTIYGRVHPNILGLVCLNSLTFLEISWNSNYTFASQVIHNNSGCLQSLNVEFEHVVGLENLLFASSADNPTIFPKLRTLRLSYCGGSTSASDSIVETPKQCQPFSELVHLKLDIGHRFDDVFFRGNEETLQTLVMLGSAKCIDTLISYNVNSGRFKRLHSLRIYRSSKYTFDEDPTVTLRKAARFAFGIASNLHAIELDNFKSGKYFVPKLYRCPARSCLRVVKLPKSILSLNSIVELLQLLPTLTDLHCSFPGLIDTSDLTMGEYVEQLDSKYNPLSTAFRRLDLSVNHMVKVNAASQIAIILAILCPRLGYAVVSDYMKEEFGLALQKHISSYPFSLYANRLGLF